jgi:outer membrane lipoprotein-sorting protein
LKALIKLYIPVIIAVLLLQGCAKNQGEQYVKVHKMLVNLQTYTATAEIIVRDNKLIENYVVKQYFKYPDRYRLVVLSPDDIRGKTTIYDGDRVYIYQPRIKQLYIMENFTILKNCGQSF